MVGICVSGIRSTGRRVNEIAPNRMMTMLIMNMVTGRSIAIRGMLIRFVRPKLSLPLRPLARRSFAAAKCLAVGTLATELALAEFASGGAAWRAVWTAAFTGDD